MADTKITALTALTGADPANDVIPIVDVSDTTMAASGTTKKISVNNILGASGTATLASATITGDLTVDTNVLKVDTTNNRVGVGTATPAVDLHIQAAGSASAEVRLASATRSYNIGSTGSGYGSANNLIIYDLTGAAERYRLDASGNHFWNNVGGVAGTAMTLNATGLGVGRTPSYKLDVAGVGNFDQLRVAAANATKMDLVNTTSGLTYSLFSANTAANGFNGFAIFNGTDYDLRIVSGNLGIGVTPSAWATSASRKAIQLSTAGSISAQDTGTAPYTFVASNWVSTATGDQYILGSAAPATLYRQFNGTHSWFNAPSGTGALTFTQAMTLDASGNLIIGTTGTNWSTVAGFYYFAGSSLNITRDGNPSLLLNRLTSDGTIADFRRSGSAVGSISVTTTSTAYNTSSDYRLKESVAPLTGGLARISALKPSIYKWKADGSNGEGFLAHELAEVVPAAVTGEKDAVNDDGSIKAQGVDLSKVVPVLVAAIQELTARVQTLETR